ncbi:MAG: hypothetical protein FJ030_13650 [Chloroflexi bacterium]|nr:hypothetical protein [Chloroflexota bacterium]
MRTPYGAECKHYYADFNRGRNTQECRLPRSASGKWTPDLCKACPIPRIQLANACPHLVLNGRIERGFLGLTRRMSMAATCSKASGPVAEPAIGCGHCHEDSPALQFSLE